MDEYLKNKVEFAFDKINTQAQVCMHFFFLVLEADSIIEKSFFTYGINVAISIAEIW